MDSVSRTSRQKKLRTSQGGGKPVEDPAGEAHALLGAVTEDSITEEGLEEKPFDYVQLLRKIQDGHTNCFEEGEGNETSKTISELLETYQTLKGKQRATALQYIREAFKKEAQKPQKESLINELMTLVNQASTQKTEDEITAQVGLLRDILETIGNETTKTFLKHQDNRRTAIDIASNGKNNVIAQLLRDKAKNLGMDISEVSNKKNPWTKVRTGITRTRASKHVEKKVAEILKAYKNAGQRRRVAIEAQLTEKQIVALYCEALKK
ncbi:MAG: hypothetical protein VW378_07820, partial [bacterium]